VDRMVEGSVRQIHAQRLAAHAVPGHHRTTRVQRLVHPHAMVIPYRVVKATTHTDPYEGGVVYRTAPIKHHLRAKVRTPDKISTYEHDYSSIQMRPKLSITKEAAGSSSSTDVTGISSSRSYSSSSSRSIASSMSASSHVPGKGLTTERHHRLTAMGTVERLSSLQRSLSGPIHLAINDWSGSWWSPKAYPQMCEGGTDRQLHLRQMVHRLNLRSPDLLNHVY
ncbi:hypothetical protein FOZ60_016232, partial [Perkinsus olseni]